MIKKQNYTLKTDEDVKKRTRSSSKDQYYLDFNERSAEHLLRNSREALKEAVCVERAMKRHNFHLVEFPA